MRNVLVFVISVFVLLGLAGCASRPGSVPSRAPAYNPPVATSMPVAEPVAAVATPVPTGPDTSRDYVVGAGDVLRITVYQSPDLSLETRVAESGLISYPLLGQVAVGGQTVAQVQTAIADGLKNGNFIRQPQVSVLLVQVRGNQASVLGMAAKPGRYPIEVSGMRLSQLLAMAGGVAAGGSELVTLSGVRDGKPFRQKVDIGMLFGGNDQVDDPIVLNGDTLYVDRLPVAFIYGEVQRPGPIPLLPGMTLMQAVASGGGLTQRGTERGMRIHRRTASGKVEVIEPRMNDVLQTGDVIYVRESLF